MQIMDELLQGEWKRTLYAPLQFQDFSTHGRTQIGSWSGTIARSDTARSPMSRFIPVPLPSADDFPYTIRIISDILESNGSSSMASVCGGALTSLRCPAFLCVNRVRRYRDGTWSKKATSMPF